MVIVTALVFPFNTRSDHGTETVIAVAIQYSLHDVHNTGAPNADSHRYVPSVRNQKVESAWTRYLKAIGYRIMGILQEGFDNGTYNDCNIIEKYYYS